MKKVPQGFDFSFLNEEEARKILRVLERNEELRRAEKDRISKLQKTKRDIRWLQGATGEWFEEIQRKKFCNETDVNQMLKPPLTYRLQKGMAKNDPMELQTSRPKSLMNQKPSVSPRMSFRSSFASLFSFRRSGKETLKLQSQKPTRCDEHARPSASVRGTVSAKIYSLPVGNQPVTSVFVPKPAVMREESGVPPPWDASLLDSEFFQVLDDLDSKLAQEQFADSMNPRTPFNYGSRTQFKLSHRNGHGHTTGRHQNYHRETSNMSIYDILRPGTPREGFKTFSPRTKTIYDMYRTREPRVLKEDFMQKNAFGSSSLCFDGRQRAASPATGRFTARSLHFPADAQNKSSFTPVRHQQSPKRTPLSSIIWNRSDASRHRQNQEESVGIPAPMDIDPAEHYVSPRCFQESRRYEVCHSQNAFQSYPLNVPVDNAMSPDPLEDSENMPFYRQNNPFARSFFSSTFRQSREQRFGQNSFWSRQEERSSWSDFPQSRKSFPSSDTDFEMISVDTNRAPSVCSHGVPSQHRRPHSPGRGTYIFRGQEDSHCWRLDFQAPPLENMDTSHANEHQFPPRFVTIDGFSVTDSSCHIQSSGLDSQQGHFPIEEAVAEDLYLFGKAQTPVSSFRTLFPLSPDDRREPQSSSFQKPTATLKKTIPNRPDSLPTRNCTEVPVACSHSTEPLFLTETQPNIPATEMNSEKDADASVSEDEQLNKMDQKNRPTGLPQSVLRTVISNDLPDFPNAHFQDSTQNDRYGFSVSAAEHPRRSLRVMDTSQMHTTQRDQSNELNKNKCFSGDKRLDSATSLPVIQESGAPTSLPGPNQGCHQKTGSNEDSSSTIKNSHWCFETPANQTWQPPGEPAVLDHEPQQSPSAHSTNDSKLVTGHSVSGDPLHVSSDAPQDSLPLRGPSFNAFLVPSTTVLSRSLSDQDPGQEQREEKDRNQNDQLAVDSTDKQESREGPALPHDAVHCRPYSPFRNGRGKGRVRRRVSCIEKLTKTESRAAPAREGSSCAEEQSSSKAPAHNTVYCTLPRKPASFLIHSRPQERTAASVRNGPLPFQIKSKAEVPTGKSTSDEPGSPESMGDAADSAVGTPKATKRMTDMKAIRSASVRKGPLPFLIKRATSCPSGEPCTLAENGEREKSPVLDTGASPVIPRPGGRIFNSLEGDLSFSESAFSGKEHTGKNSESPVPRMSSLTLSTEPPEPLCATGSRKESGKALHKFKTTSMFSVSGDEENVKCLEVVSIYYTLPRKPSKKFCSLLQQYAQGSDSLRNAFQGETKVTPNALEIDELNCPAQSQSGMPPLQDLKMQADSVPCSLALSPESKAVSQLPDREASKSTLEEMASVEPDVSLHREEPKIEEISPSNVSKTTVDDSLNREKRGKEPQILQTPVPCQETGSGEQNTKSHQQPSKGGNSGPSALPSRSEDKVENSQTRRDSGTCAGGVATLKTGNGRTPWRNHVAALVGDRSSRSQPTETSGTTGSDCQNLTDKMFSDSESQAFALTPALHKLQLAEEAQTGGAGLPSGPRQAGRQEANTAEMRKVADEGQMLTWDQTLLSRGNNKNKTNTDDLETKDRYSGTHRWGAISKASKKIPAKELSPRKHVATIFSQSESKSGFRLLSLCRPEDNPLSAQPIVKPAESTDESNVKNVDKSETLLQASTVSSPGPPDQSCNQKSANILQPHLNGSHSVLETPPKSEGSKAQISGELGAPARLTLTSPLEKSSGHQQRLSPPFPLEPTQKSTINSHCQLRHRSAPSPESEPEPHLYRSKSLRNFSVHSDLLCISHPPKARGRHFSENTSIDNALSQLSLEDGSSPNSGYSRRFKSFSELPASYESESWTSCSNRTRGLKSTSSISRPIDYGIFGKEQQLAFLENVKRSLTQGRLWKPSFLKNPGFLKDDVLNVSNLSQSELLDSPAGQVSEDGLLPGEPLNIYKDDPGDPLDSDWDTDTTTDDEYYLDENDKESEL